MPKIMLTKDIEDEAEDIRGAFSIDQDTDEMVNTTQKLKAMNDAIEAQKPATDRLVEDWGEDNASIVGDRTKAAAKETISAYKDATGADDQELTDLLMTIGSSSAMGIAPAANVGEGDADLSMGERLKEIPKGYARGKVGQMAGMGSLAEWMGENMPGKGGDFIEKHGSLARHYWKDVLNKELAPLEGHTVKQYPFSKGLEIIMQAIPSLETAMAAGGVADLATKGSVVAAKGVQAIKIAKKNAQRMRQIASAFSIGLQGAGSEAMAAKDAGAGQTRRNLVGLANLASETLTELIPMGILTDFNADEVVQGGMQVFKAAMRRAALGGGAEGTQEFIQNTFSNIIAKVGYERGRPLMQGALESVIGGAGAGAAVGFMMHNSFDVPGTETEPSDPAGSIFNEHGKVRIGDDPDPKKRDEVVDKVLKGEALSDEEKQFVADNYSEDVEEQYEDQRIRGDLIDLAPGLMVEARGFDNAEAFVESKKLTEQSKPHEELSPIAKEIGVENFGDEGVFQKREGTETDPKAVKKWEKKIKKGKKPVLITGGKGSPVLIDGSNRLEAYKNLGYKTVPVVDESQLADVWKHAKKVKPRNYTDDDLRGIYDKNFEGWPDLDEENRLMETRASEWAKENINTLIRQYEAKKGNWVDPDVFRWFLEDLGYNGSNSNTFQEVASALSKVYVHLKLEQAVFSGRKLIVFTAGGMGSGKSEGFKTNPLLMQFKKDAGLVIDGTFSKYGSSKEKIDKMLKMGLEPRVVYTYKSPIEAWILGAIERCASGRDERAIALNVFLPSYVGAYQNFQRMRKEYADSVEFMFVNNTVGRGKADFYQDDKEFDNIVKPMYTMYEDNIKEVEDVCIEAVKKVYYEKEGRRLKPAHAKTFLEGFASSDEAREFLSSPGFREDLQRSGDELQSRSEGKTTEQIYEEVRLDYEGKVYVDDSFFFGDNVEMDPEELALEEAELTVAAFESGQDLFQMVKEVGFIKRYGGNFLAEEQRGVNKKYFKKDASLTGDKVADQLGFETEDDLYESLRVFDKLKPDKSLKYKEARKLIREHYSRLRKGSIAMQKLIAQVRKTTSILSPSKTKSLIRKETGQFVAKDLISEDKAFRRALAREEAAARKAFSEGKKFEKTRLRELQRERKVKDRARKEFTALVKKIHSIKTATMDEINAQEIRQIQAQLDYATPTTKTRFKLKRIADYLAKNPEAEVPDYVIQELDRLNKYNRDNITLDQLRTMNDAVSHFAALAKLKNSIRVGREVRRAGAVKLASIQEMKPLEDSQNDLIDATVDKKRPLLNLKYLLGLGQDHFDLIVESVAGIDSVTYDILFKQVKDGIKVQQEIEEQLEQMAYDHIKGMEFQPKNMAKWLKEKVETGRFTFTRGQRISMWLHSLNDNNMRHLQNGFALKQDPYNIIKWRNGELKSILNSMTQEEIELATANHMISEKAYQILDNIFYEKNGYHLPKEDNYFPIEVAKASMNDDLAEQSLLDQLAGMFARIGVVKNMINKRVKSKLPIVIDDYFKVLRGHIDHVSAYGGLEVPLSNASKLLYDRDWKAAFVNRYGIETWQEIEKGLRDIAGQHQRFTKLGQATMAMKNLFTKTVYGLNLGVFMKQTLSFPLFNVYVDAGHLFAGFGSYLMNGKEIRARHAQYSVQWRSRLKMGFNKDMAAVASAQNVARLFGGNKKMADRLMGGLKLFDRNTVAAGMEGAVLQKMAELKDSGLTVSEKMKQAYEYADWVVNRTQPSFAVEHRSPISRGNAFERMATFATAATNQQLNLIRRTFGQWQRTKTPEDLRKFLLAVFWSTLVIPLGVMMMDKLADIAYRKKKPDPIDLWETIGRIVNSNAAMLYFVRTGVNSMVSKFERGTYRGYDVNSPITNMANNAINTFVNLTEGLIEQNEKKIIRGLDGAVEMAFFSQGLPYRTGKKLAGKAIGLAGASVEAVGSLMPKPDRQITFKKTATKKKLKIKRGV